VEVGANARLSSVIKIAAAVGYRLVLAPEDINTPNM
jgi:hypothetical protein